MKDLTIKYRGHDVKFQFEILTSFSVGVVDGYGEDISFYSSVHIDGNAIADMVSKDEKLLKKLIDSAAPQCDEVYDAIERYGKRRVFSSGVGYEVHTPTAKVQKEKTPGDVYIIGVTGNDLFKVGITNRRRSTTSRLETIKNASPYDIYHVKTYSVSDMRSVERAAHNKLREFKTNREWFGCPLETIISAVESAIDEVG